MTSKGFVTISRKNEFGFKVPAIIDQNLKSIAVACIALSVLLIGFTSGLSNNNSSAQVVKIIEKIHTEIFINLIPDKSYVSQKIVIGSDENINFTALNFLPNKAIFNEISPSGLPLSYYQPEATICSTATTATLVNEKEDYVHLKSEALTDSAGCSTNTRSISYQIDGAVVPYGNQILANFFIWPDKYQPEVKESKIDLYLPDNIIFEQLNLQLFKTSNNQLTIADYSAKPAANNKKLVTITLNEVLPKQTGLTLKLKMPAENRGKL